MRPGWCPYPDTCAWVTRGGESLDSGVACGGHLPEPQDHHGDLNTHRLCMRSADGDVARFEVNQTDLWYLGLVVGALHKEATGDYP